MNKWGGVNDMPNGWAAKNKRLYQLWIDIMRRCYDEDQLSRAKGKAYRDCKVCEEWKRLSVFAEDIKKVPGYAHWEKTTGMVLDKDILGNGEKVYNRKNCCFIPRDVNLAVMNRQNPDITRNAVIANTAIYELEKDGKAHIFQSEMEACEFLGVKKCSVAGAWRDRGMCRGYKVRRLGTHADMRKEDRR